MKKIVLAALSFGFVLSLSASATAQIKNNRDGSGNLIRQTAPTNTAPPMINSTNNNPRRPVAAPTTDPNIAPWQRK
jgi:hypothetical protein